jgi:hypothetical protein
MGNEWTAHGGLLERVGFRCSTALSGLSKLRTYTKRIKGSRRSALAARGISKPGGGIVIVGLDRHVEAGRWWIYETFPSAHVEKNSAVR